MYGFAHASGAGIANIALLTFSTLAFATTPVQVPVQPAEAAQDDTPASFQHTEQQALGIYRATVAKHWPQAEVSDPRQWVDYSADWQTKRVVDFYRNEIRISVKRTVSSSDLPPFTMAFPSSGRTIPASVEEAFDHLLNSTGATDSPQQRLTQIASTLSVPIQLEHADIYAADLPRETIRKKARQYLGLVKAHAAHNRLTPALLMALIHTESNFDPYAKSPVPAYGLMQIVPQTAGRDAAKLVYNKNKLLTPEYLYDPENNIKIGSTYLGILYYQYLKEIKDPRSRLFCAIAAYNTGTANVARAFVRDGKLRDAFVMINEMAPQQVLEKLLRHLPYRETRSYVQQVLSRQQYYSRR